MSEKEVNMEEPSWLIFLKQLAESISLAANDLDGLVNWCIDEVDENRKAVKIGYIEDGEEFPRYHIFLGKRYFSRNMVRVVRVGEAESPGIFIEANPEAILAYISM
jgi:hypothetical protein